MTLVEQPGSDWGVQHPVWALVIMELIIAGVGVISLQALAVSVLASSSDCPVGQVVPAEEGMVNRLVSV